MNEPTNVPSHKPARLFTSILMLGFFWSILSGFGSEHSSVETKAAYDKKQSSLTMTFIVKPNKGMKIAPEGPWSLSLEKTGELKLESDQEKFETKTFDESIPGFRVNAKVIEGKKSGSVAYKIRAFICTEDKTRCYPQALEGKLDWKI